MMAALSSVPPFLRYAVIPVAPERVVADLRCDVVVAEPRASRIRKPCDLEATLVGGSFVDGEPETPRRQGADGAYRRIDWEPTRLLWVLNLRKRSHRERPSVG